MGEERNVMKMYNSAQRWRRELCHLNYLIRELVAAINELKLVKA